MAAAKTLGVNQSTVHRRLLELEFDVRLPLISAGSSVVLAALLQGNVPKEINHYRIGEAAFLGTDLLGGGTLDGLENAVTIEGEIIDAVNTLRKKFDYVFTPGGIGPTHDDITADAVAAACAPARQPSAAATVPADRWRPSPAASSTIRTTRDRPRPPRRAST